MLCLEFWKFGVGPDRLNRLKDNLNIKGQKNGRNKYP